MDREKIKVKILHQALASVPREGWSEALLDHAAMITENDASLGWRLFPKGPTQAIDLWHSLLDKEMEASLPPAESLRVRERVREGVKTRLLLLAPHRELARKTAIYLARPSLVGHGARLIYRTVDKIWYYAGDTSTDYNFYTKRALLTAVYSATFLHWLQDEGEEFEKTWAFLEKRIEQVLVLASFPHRILGRMRSQT